MNKALLRYEMLKNDINIKEICEQLKISRSAFYRKCNGKSDFTQSEIKAIVNLLKLDTPVEIFFAE